MKNRATVCIIIIAILSFGLYMGILQIGNAAGTDIAKTGEKPKTLNIAMVTDTVLEEPWNTVWIQAMDRVVKEKPHGLDINYTYTENVHLADGQRVLEAYAKSGEYGIIWMQGTYPEGIKNLHKKYPEILWAMAGTGNPLLGENAYLLDIRVHEAAYLLGMIAGLMTETNVVSAVAGFPYAGQNLCVNAFFDGAKAVNPKVKPINAYIDSWFDPPKAKEAALAQIASGSDFIYAERFGPFEAAKEKNVLAFGHFADQYELGPEVCVSSTVGFWDPTILYMIDEWWNHVTEGIPYNAPMDFIYARMKDGGSDIAPYHNFEDKIPSKVKEVVNKTRQDIKSGKFTVPENLEKFSYK